jgi:hypothetical protein
MALFRRIDERIRRGLCGTDAGSGFVAALWVLD